jgi:single-strand DNA-binding protein
MIGSTIKLISFIQKLQKFKELEKIMSANVSILGNLGRAPETQMSAGGVQVTKFSIASNSVKRTPQGTVEKTDWFRVTAFGKQAETLAKYAKKGSRIYVQGSLNLSAWRDRQDRAQYSADLLLQDFQFVGGAAAGDDVQEIAQPAGAY